MTGLPEAMASRQDQAERLREARKDEQVRGMDERNGVQPKTGELHDPAEAGLADLAFDRRVLRSVPDDDAPGLRVRGVDGRHGGDERRDVLLGFEPGHAHDEGRVPGDAEFVPQRAGPGHPCQARLGDPVWDDGYLFRRRVAAGDHGVAHGRRDRDEMAHLPARPMVRHGSEHPEDSPALQTARLQEMLGGDAGARARPRDGQRGGEHGTAVVRVDEIEFARGEHPGQFPDGGPIDRTALLDRHHRQAALPGALVEGRGKRAGDADIHLAGAPQLPGQLQDVAFGARKYVGIREQRDAEFHGSPFKIFS